MKKFTVFTLLLTIVIIVVVSEIVVNEYLPTLGQDDTADADLEFTLPKSLDLSKSIETNVLEGGLNNRLGADTGENFDLATASDVEPTLDIPSQENSGEFLPVAPSLPNVDESTVNGGESAVADFEDQNFSTVSANVYLRDEQIKSAGFVGAYIEREAFDDYLFKTIFVGDLYDTEIEKNTIRTNEALLAKVYIFKIGPDSDTDEVYQLFKMRAAEGAGIEVNETNEFGVNSFYMNDSTRSNTAFLTVRIGSLIYAFSYPKEYHSQIKNLAQLLEWEFN